MKLDRVLTTAMNSPVGRKVTGALGLAEAATLRRGTATPGGPIVFAELAGASGTVAEALAALHLAPAEPVLDTPPPAPRARTDENARPPTPARSARS